MNKLLNSTEQDYSQGRVRNFFARIMKYKKYNPMLKAVKSVDGRLLIELDKKNRWVDGILKRTA